jgi:hypothetical protein
MSGHWFRMYDDVIFCPKVLRLTADQRWFWITFLAIYSGNCPKSLPKIDLILRSNLRKTTAEKYILALKEAGLIDEDDQGLRPHNWDKRQYKSDISTERVKRFRNVSKAVSETPPDTDTDTDTDSDSERKKVRKKDSSSAPVPITTYAFSQGVIRLNKKDFDEICETYPRMNVRGELTAMADWAGRFGTKWWVPVMNLLAKKDREFRDRAELARVTANANDITKLFPKPPGSW